MTQIPMEVAPGASATSAVAADGKGLGLAAVTGAGGQVGRALLER